MMRAHGPADCPAAFPSGHALQGIGLAMIALAGASRQQASQFQIALYAFGQCLI
jgi:hypothetical protein